MYRTALLLCDTWNSNHDRDTAILDTIARYYRDIETAYETLVHCAATYNRNAGAETLSVYAANLISGVITGRVHAWATKSTAPVKCMTMSIFK